MTTTVTTWPAAAELERGYKILGEAQETLEGLEQWANALLSKGIDDGDEPSLEELGRLTAFVSAAESDFESMHHSVKQLAHVRDVATPQR